MQNKFSIKDLERISGIKAHTLRIWEQRYEILNPERTDTNIRYYTNADLVRILNISLLNNNGYKISNIAQLGEDELKQKVNKILNSFSSESAQVDNLMLSLMDMDEDKFESTINNCVLHFGFENTMEKIVFPFLKQMGNMWLSGIISPAQEHYISNLVRQKIIVGIDKISVSPNSASKKFIFFLPNDELHEMGLLYAYYLCKARGHKCMYLGQSVPIEDLEKINQSILPDYLVSILTAQMTDEGMNNFLKACEEKIKSAKIMLGGRLIVNKPEHIHYPSERFVSFNEFVDFKKLI